MPIPPCFLTKCKVYSECQKCRKTLKSTRGERSHLQQCCFNDFDQGNRLTGQENAAPESCSSGSNRAHSQCATSVASNSCVGAVQSVQQGRDPDAVLQLEVTGGHGSIMITPAPFRFIAVVTREATFAELDCLLRCIWFECCGHLSSFKVGDDPMPNKHPDKLVQQSQRERHREQHEFLRPARTPLYKVHMVRCPPSSRDPVMEQLDEDNHHDIHDEWLGRPEVRQQMREVRRLRAENGEYGSDPDSESDSELGYSDGGAEQEAAAEPGRQKPDPSSRLVDWLTLPGQVVGYGYNGHDVGSDAEIKVGEWHNLNHDVRSHLGKKTVMVLARNQQPTPGCVRCSQPSEAAYFKYYPNFDSSSVLQPFNLPPFDAEQPDFFCNECMKVRRPSYGRLDEHGHPVADSDVEAEPADGEEELDENDEDYWLKEDADERAYNKAVALDNTPQLGQCGVRGQPNHSCYDHENRHVSEKVMWRW